MAIVEIMGILNFDDGVQFWYTITVLLPSTENDSTGNSSLVVRSIVYIFFRAISRTTSTFCVISQENVFESSLAEPENRIYHR